MVMAVAAATYIACNGDIWPQQFAVDWDAAYMLCPDLRPGKPRVPTSHAPWDHGQVQAWFLKQNAPPSRELVVRAPGRLPRRRRHLLCWWFPAGSTHRSSGNTPRHASIGILPDGRRVYGFDDCRASLRPLDADEGFNAAALTQMAKLAQLPSLLASPVKPSR
jgi:hypothetical protein